jgi:hypothetical protein
MTDVEIFDDSFEKKVSSQAGFDGDPDSRGSVLGRETLRRHRPSEEVPR